MHVAELPLLIFTILGQMSVGAFVALGFLNVLGRARWGAARVQELSDVALFAIGPTLVLGFMGSFLHLGNPINATNAMNNLGSSGMSREILFGVLFAGAGAVYAVCQYLRILPPLAREALAAVTAVLGLILVWVMADLYMLETAPAWNLWTTPVSFYATTGLLGSMAVATALALRLRFPFRVPRPARFSTSYEKESKGFGSLEDETTETAIVSALTWLLVGAMLMLAVVIIAAIAQVSILSTDDSRAAQESLAILTEHGGLWQVLRIGLSVAGTGLLGFAMFRLRLGKEVRGRGVWRILPLVVVAAFILVFAGEVIGRELFYSSYVRVGM